MKEMFMLAPKSELDLAVFTYEVSDEALEAAAGNNGGLFCSCTPCKSGCSPDSR